MASKFKSEDGGGVGFEPSDDNFNHVELIMSLATTGLLNVLYA